MNQVREELPFDVLFVGGGPACLAGAIHLMNLAKEKGMEIEVGLIEKGDTIGCHSISGAILDPVALKELVPDYMEKGFPVEGEECRDGFYFLTRNRRFRVPFTPKYMHNKECRIISLSKFTKWLGELAEALEVNIFPGFAGAEVLYNSENNQVMGVRTGDKGVDKEGNKKSIYEPGVDLLAKVTVFGEGSKGNLIRDMGQKMEIFSQKMPQFYETAIKEVIEIPESSPFFTSDMTVMHSFGYPLGLDTKGGGFLYKMKDNRVSLGIVIGLDYEDPLMEPYEKLLRFKKHPFIAGIIKDGKVLQQGANTLSAGGYYTMLKLAVDGALFVGDSASMLNTQRLKGIHTAMKSGMLATETIIEAFENNDFSRKILKNYELNVEKSWIMEERYKARNFAQALSKKGLLKFVHIGAQYFTGGRGIKDPLSIKEDSSTLKKLSKKKASKAQTQVNQDFDEKLCVDKKTGVFLSGTQHVEDQPSHIKVHDLDLCTTKCYDDYRNPCIRFCPGEVYEMIEEDSGARRLMLNPSNCLHCKTCEIKDPYKNITWTCPEGGGGPKYSIM